MLNKKEIGAKIRALREARGMTQTELAQAIGVTYQQIQKYEKGVSSLSIDRLLQVAKGLNVEDPSYFYEAREMTLRESPENAYRVSDLSKVVNSSNEVATILSKEEIKMIKNFRNIDSKLIRSSIMKILKGIVDVEMKARNKKTSKK